MMTPGDLEKVKDRVLYIIAEDARSVAAGANIGAPISSTEVRGVKRMAKRLGKRIRNEIAGMIQELPK